MLDLNSLNKFVDFVLSQNVLSFGDFTLKSGISSPYFFNAGGFKTGKALALLGEFYADLIAELIKKEKEKEKLEFDMLFGPAYKGIPLVCSVAIALYKKYGIDKPYCFNRKEMKDHGEGGALVGEKLHGKVLIIDDVVTRGTAFEESRKIIADAGADVVGLCVCLDRQEKQSGGNQTAIEQIRKKGFSVEAILTAENLVNVLLKKGNEYLPMAEKIKAHLDSYGSERG